MTTNNPVESLVTVRYKPILFPNTTSEEFTCVRLFRIVAASRPKLSATKNQLNIPSQHVSYELLRLDLLNKYAILILFDFKF